MKLTSKFAIAFLFAGLAFATPPVPRPAQDLTMTQAGKPASLASYRGKVVLMQFLFTTCPHCQASAQIYSKLQTELGPQGLQVVGIAFNEEAAAGPAAVDNFISSNHVLFPVGVTPRDNVLNFLGISFMERFVVPQIVVIDRKGIIRAQSQPLGTEQLQDEAYMRTFLSGLLKEGKTPVLRTATH